MSEIIDINVTKQVEQIDINVTENVIEVNINSVSGGGATWGEIDGTLSNQTDLQNALNLKADASDLDNLVPYTGATQNVDLGTNSLSAISLINDSNADYENKIDFSGATQIYSRDKITEDFNTLDLLPTSTDSKKLIIAPALQFSTVAVEDNAVGKLKWNDLDGTLDLGLKGGNVNLQIGQESVIRVVNKTGSNLLESNYQAVRVNGAQGQRLKIALAQATNDLLSAETIGLVTENIDNNQEGFVTTSGLIRNINTTGSLQSETWADGDMLYLSPSVAGRITNVKPSAPNHLITIGYVVYAHANNGSIFVKVDNGYELEELHNVTSTNYTTPIDTDSVLTFDVTNSLWKRFSFSSLKTWLDNYLTASKIKGYLGITTLSGSNTGDQDLSGLATKSMSAYSMRVNNTNATANATEITFQQTNKGVYTGGITWTGITAPSGTTSHSYNWQRVGNLVTLNVTLFYQNTGTALTSVVMDFMNDFPTPVKPDGLTGASEVLYNGSGDIRQTATSSGLLPASSLLRSNASNNGFQLVVTQGSISAKIVKITIQYFTA